MASLKQIHVDCILIKNIHTQNNSCINEKTSTDTSPQVIHFNNNNKLFNNYLIKTLKHSKGDENKAAREKQSVP